MDKPSGINDVANMLTWLANIYWSAPTKEQLSRFADIVLPINATSVASAAAELADTIDGLDDGSIHDVSVDSTGLFYGFDQDAPFPYESIYNGAERMLMQRPAGEVATEYSAYGFKTRSDGDNEPADHISKELEFMV
jgi:TorA maturation chaperone TorD